MARIAFEKLKIGVGQLLNRKRQSLVGGPEFRRSENASQLARAPGAVRGKGFIRMRIKHAGAGVPRNGGVELLRVEDLEPGETARAREG
jgi:hypothetical protein